MSYIDEIIKLAQDPMGQVTGGDVGAQGPARESAAVPQQAEGNSTSDVEQLKAEIKQGIAASDELLAVLAGGESQVANSGQAPLDGNEQTTTSTTNPGGGITVNVNIPGQEKTAAELLAIEELSRVL